MKYKCTSCGKIFIIELDEVEKIRCPYCKRIHGIEELHSSEEEKKEGSSGKKRLVIILLIIVVGGIVLSIIGIYLKQKENIGEVHFKNYILSEEKLEKICKSLNIKDKTLLFNPIVIDNQIIEKSKEILKGEKGKKGLEKILNYLERLLKKQEHTPYKPYWTRPTPPLTSNKVLQKLIGKEDFHPYSLEVTSLILALLQAGGGLTDNIKVVELFHYKNEQKPIDPIAMFPHLGIAYIEDEGIEGTIYDITNFRKTSLKDVEYKVINPVEFIGYGSSLKGSYYLERELDLERGYKEIEIGTTLSPQSPTLRGMYGYALLQSSGDPKLSLEQLEKALKLRNDPPRKVILSLFLLLLGNISKSHEYIQEAIDIMPEYGWAHAVNSMLHLAKNEIEEAEKELELATRLDPENPRIKVIWAQLYLRRGDENKAISLVKEMIKKDPNNFALRQNLVEIYEESALFEDMRNELREIVRMVPEKRKKELHQKLQERYGSFELEAKREEVKREEFIDGGITQDIEKEEILPSLKLTLPEYGKNKPRLIFNKDLGQKSILPGLNLELGK